VDDILSLVVGRPAPEIDGTDLDGKHMKLSDYRGKVIVLTFWGSWCGPCLAQLPKERELAERMKERPFTFLGVDCEEEKESARKVIQRERITWPNWFDGAPHSGVISQRYHVSGFPTIYVIDAKGVIRLAKASFANPVAMEELVEKLVKEAE
jgi:peroxiredoxin